MHIFHLKLEKNHPYYNDNKVNYQNNKTKTTTNREKRLDKKTSEFAIDNYFLTSQF